MKQLLAMLILLFGLFGGAQAQTISDTELQAAYCLGVATEQEEGDRKEAAAAKDSSIKQLHETVANIIAERRMRFRDYLTAKGFLFGRDASAIKLAIMRGPTDVKSCQSELKLAFYKDCSNQCDRLPTTERRSACKRACPSPQPCERIKSCLENFLPF